MKIKPEDFYKENADDCLAIINRWKEDGRTIVTTNGCFDLIHAGHIQYLHETASLGDKLVVGLNSDASVKRLKGETRPLQNESDRLKIMASLKMVDLAFIFSEDDPREFIKLIKPDFHVKGGDYTEDILERETVEENGGKVAIVSFKDGRSTTGIINKMNR